LVEIDVHKRFIPIEALVLICSYIIDFIISDELLNAFLAIQKELRGYSWTQEYSSDELIQSLKDKQPNRSIQSLVPRILNKSYEELGSDSPSAEMFADIAYEILKMERPEKRLNKTPLVKTIVEFIQNDLATREQ
jgi:hypothetical protein